ncbi:MAG: rhomboid family intramembrane serine protease [Gammaproteobacteria bacterium]|nr:rhomboid family intramembrane serine protease [Gammaproteobacteria bacterium]
MQWHQVYLFSLDVDLSPLIAVLKQRYIAHRVTEEVRGQCLWVADSNMVEPLQEFIKGGGLARLEPAAAVPKGAAGVSRGPLYLRILRVWNNFPVTLLSIYLGVLGALLVSIDHDLHWVSLLTFQPLEVAAHQLKLLSVWQGLEGGQWWRLVTPVFLHFGLFHILFNGLWVWEFGRRIEVVFGSGWLLLLLLYLSVFSNMAQYLWSGPALFGGLSGVLYGLMGFLWIGNWRRPHATLAIPKGIIGFMLVWMGLCMSGVVDAFMSGSIANGAHFGGLLGGMLMGLLAPKLVYRV